MKKTIAVLIVDDHALIRDMLAERLAAENDMRVVGAAADADEAVTLVVKHQPQVVIFDIDMPGLLCFSAARTIRARSPGTRVLFLSRFINDRFIEQALEVQAAGYVSKEQPLSEVIQAIRTVASGGVHFSPQVQSRIVIDQTGARLAPSGRSRLATLSNRELEVLQYIARGMSRRQIAGTMHLSQKTVDSHCAALMTKLNMHSSVELTRFAIREGLAIP